MAGEEGCFLVVEESGGLDAVSIQNTAVPVLNEYVDRVAPIPQGGIRAQDCRYSVSLTRSEGSLFLSLSGRRINSLASSDEPGMKGYTQALLRAVHKTFTREDEKGRICRQYPALLASDCRMIEALFYLHDANGNRIANGSSVRSGDRFYVMVKPLTPLYAYIVSKDSGNQLFKIFPNRAVTDIPNPLNARYEYIFPPSDSDLVFEFDNQPGIEKFYFVFSAVPLREITRYFSGGSQKVSEFEQRIMTRGITLVEQKKSVPVTVPKGGSEPKDVDELKGMGVIVREMTLKHL